MADATINVTVTEGGTISSDLSGATSVSSTVTEGGVISATLTGGGVGPKGDTGSSGIDGRNPLTVSAAAPGSPQQGDLWYKP